ncbi:MAG TPA: tetratricopeptide repeat protein [Gemmatimonadaceae bacterium]|nr:tetratricopeptide repeat protein [Gemmatimonadaceae bacterium]
MTSLPPTADEILEPLRAQIDLLARDLAGVDGDGEAGVVLKQRIFLLHRSVEQHAQLIETMQGEVRSLVDAWKGRFGNSASPTGNAAIAAAPVPAAPTTAPPPAPTPIATPEIAQAPEALPTPVGREPICTPTSSRAAFHAPVAGQPRVIDELNASTFVERGWSRIATGDFAGAEEALDKALSLNPGDPHAETLLGWAQSQQGKLDAAMALFQQVLDRVPDHALAHINVGYVHLRRRHYALAIEHLDTAIAFDSDRKATLYAHYYLGLVHFEQEEWAESIGALLRAIELGPNLIEARYELGRVYWFADRTDDAIAAWRKGAELNKFNPWSTRCREMLATIADGGAPKRVA